MDYIGLALAILKFVNFIMGKIDREQAKADGRNELIAEQTLLLLERTERGKAIMEKVYAMSDDDVDAEFARLVKLRTQRSGGT
jgi:hypothetical protein